MMYRRDTDAQWMYQFAMRFRPLVICTKNKDSRAQRRHVFTKSSDALRGSRGGKGVGDSCLLHRDCIGQVTCLSFTLFLPPPIFLSIFIIIYINTYSIWLYIDTVIPK